MRIKDLPQPNLLDRAIRAISPSWALQRHQSRVAMALTGGYSGAGYRENMVNWQPGVGDADSDTNRDLRELRARSRDLNRNSPIAGGAIETMVTHIVGTGLSLRPRIDAEFLSMTPEQAQMWQKNTLREFDLWADGVMCDVMRAQNFYELQDLAFRSSLESGDSFVVLAGLKETGWPYKLALQVIEADRVCNPDGKADTEGLTQGIERDSAGAPRAAHICNKHPGRYLPTKGAKWERVPFRGAKSGRLNLIHLFRKLRPGQTRGVPVLSPIIEPLKQLTRYSQAEVDAAVNSAAFAVFAKMDPEAFEDILDDEGKEAYINRAVSWDGSIGTGKVVNLLPGEEIESAQMSRPNPNFDPFVSAVMRQIGIGLGIPYEVLTKHFQSSYSAARAALLDAWRTFRIRREWLVSKLCQPVYEEWLAEAVSIGRVSAPGFFADPAVRKAYCGAVWTGDGPGALNPRDEAEAAKVRLEIGLTTLDEEIVAYDGGDFETKHAQQVREREMRVDSGLAEDLTAPEPVAPMPGQAPQPAQPARRAVAEGEDGSMATLSISEGAFSVNVQPPAVHVPAPVVHVAAPIVNVEAPNVSVEAAMPAPEVRVINGAPAANVINTPEQASAFRVIRDETGAISGVERVERD